MNLHRNATRSATWSLPRVLTIFFACSLVLVGLSSCRPTSSSSAGGSKAKQTAPQGSKRKPRNSPKASSENAENAENATAKASGDELYARHCSTCHGKQGDGKGLAAAFLFPKPRDFRAGRFRLISSTNGVPTDADLHEAVARGMPGSSMPPWAHLGEENLKLLVERVRQFRRDGLHDILVTALKEEDEEAEIDEEQVLADVRSATTPADVFGVPATQGPSRDAVEQGRALYVKQACHSCHGKEGKGDGQQKMIDDEGLPTLPRDFTKGIFKGVDDFAAVYRRIALGMPGTPMPSSRATLSPEQMAHVTHFVLSLSSAENRLPTVRREKLVAHWVPRVDADPAAACWNGIEAQTLSVFPLWWRDDFEPRLLVQAIHDGKSLALRLAWRDAEEDRSAARSESFDDKVAVELYQGRAEPFLGMGSTEGIVELWLWSADREESALAVEDVYPNTVVDIYPFTESKVSTAEYDRPGTRTQRQPKTALPAVAAGNPITPVQGKSGGTSLEAGGPGSVTFRPPKLQAVDARGRWNDGGWTVTMVRSIPKEAPPGELKLSPRQRVSIAFAVWDGAHRDRDGQKLISIWNDLELEAKPK